MTREQLQQTPDFQGLYSDPRFQALLAWLQKPRPFRRSVLRVDSKTQIVRNEGCLQGWLDCVEEIESLRHVPQPQPPAAGPRSLYATPNSPTR